MPSITLPNNSHDPSSNRLTSQLNAVTKRRGYIILCTLPARMSRSSWLAFPSCSEVAMFVQRCRFTLTFTELLRPTNLRSLRCDRKSPQFQPNTQHAFRLREILPRQIQEILRTQTIASDRRQRDKIGGEEMGVQESRGVLTNLTINDLSLKFCKNMPVFKHVLDILLSFSLCV